MGEGLFQPMHLLVIFAIALLVFGPRRLPELGKGLGQAIRGFKDSFHGGEVTPPTPAIRDEGAFGYRPISGSPASRGIEGSPRDPTPPAREDRTA
jgi:sec-independent protein translocase protein TatA